MLNLEPLELRKFLLMVRVKGEEEEEEEESRLELR